MSDSAIVCTYCHRTYSTDDDACPGCGTLREPDTTVPLAELTAAPVVAPPATARRLPGLILGSYWALGLSVSLLFIILALFAAGLTGNLNALILGLDVLAIAILAVNPWQLRARVPVVSSTSKAQAGVGWFGLGLIAVVALATFPGGIGAMPLVPDGLGSTAPTPAAAVEAAGVPAGAPTPTATCAVGPTEAVAKKVWVVGNTGGDGAWLRASPDPQDHLRAWLDGARMEEVGPARTVDGRQWRNVKDPLGNLGWVPAEYLLDGKSESGSAGAPGPTRLATETASGSRATTADGRTLTVDEVVTLREVGQAKAESTKVFAVLSLIIKNAESQRVAYDRLDFRMEDGEGHITKAVAVAGLDNQLHDGELAPGGSVKGFLVFEVPEGDRDLSLIWMPCAYGCFEQDIPLGESMAVSRN